MADEEKKSTDKSKKKEESEQEKRNKQLREAYEKSMENFERTSNTILDTVRDRGVSIYAPDPLENAKQIPEEISDIHILYAQQLPEYVKEGKDDSEEQEKKAKEGTKTDEKSDDSKTDSKTDKNSS